MLRATDEIARVRSGMKLLMFAVGSMAASLGFLVGDECRSRVDEKITRAIAASTQCADPDECICHCRCVVELPEPPPPDRPEDKPDDWYEK